MFASLKDKTVSFTLKQAVNFKIKEFGEMLNLKLDSQNKTIELELMLLGEKEPLNVKVGSYEISEEDGKFYLIAKDVKTSREWINIVAKNYLENQKFEIPENIAKTIKIIA
jgi:hypothetical protein